MSVKPIPDGCENIIPYLTVRDVPAAIAFYKAAFGATEAAVHFLPDGKTIMHAEIKIGNSLLYLSEECPQWGSLSPLSLNGTGVSLHLYVPDVDASFARAQKAGATVAMPPMDAFWGDRFGKLKDPFGHSWSLATHKQDLTVEEVERAGKEFFAKMAAAGAPA